MDSLRRIILWDYERGSWQYDVLCLLIIGFIFLTPSSWFERKERLATHPSSVAVQTRGISSDRVDLEKKVREISGDPASELLSWREIDDCSGENYYEVEFVR
jgi:hypothetical protein